MSQKSNAITYKTFKEIRTHTSNISHIVTNIVGNHSRVARVIFWNIHFDLAHQIGSNTEIQKT